MPLKGIINGRNIISIGMSNDEWNDLRVAVSYGQLSITLPCCGGLAYQRISTLGTKHFVHKSKCDYEWKPESADHVKMKEIIFNVCKEEGWNADPEHTFNDWIADVFASKGNKKVAFEVQCSLQSFNRTKERQAKYIQDGVKGNWVFKHFPASWDYNSKIITFEISKSSFLHPQIDDNYGQYSVITNNGDINLSSVVKKLLKYENWSEKELTDGINSGNNLEDKIEWKKLVGKIEEKRRFKQEEEEEERIRQRKKAIFGQASHKKNKHVRRIIKKKKERSRKNVDENKVRQEYGIPIFRKGLGIVYEDIEPPNSVGQKKFTDAMERKRLEDKDKSKKLLDKMKNDWNKLVDKMIASGGDLPIR